MADPLDLKGAIARASSGADLTADEIAGVFGQIMDGAASPAQIGGLLIALRMKGETASELAGAARAMRARALPVRCPDPRMGVDTCGTGGDGAGTVNISTLAALIVAACGGVVVKHGNRALSSKCGSADVLEALGIAIDGDVARVERCLDVAGIGFAFAPVFHAATRHAAGPRKELGVRTLFNLLGPMTNPAQVKHQVIGVFDRRWCEPVAAALGQLGSRRVYVVHGAGGIDEVAVRGPTHVARWDGARVESLTLSPADFGLDEVDPAGLIGGDAAHNARILRRVIGPRAGHELQAVQNAAVMTAALALDAIDAPYSDVVLERPDRPRTQHQVLRLQSARAAAALASGRAWLVLHKWRIASTAAPDDDLTAVRELVDPVDVPAYGAPDGEEA